MTSCLDIPPRWATLAANPQHRRVVQVLGGSERLQPVVRHELVDQLNGEAEPRQGGGVLGPGQQPPDSVEPRAEGPATRAPLGGRTCS